MIYQKADLESVSPIYTFGYGNRSDVSQLLAYAKQFDVEVLIDVRRSPRGWAYCWGKQSLETEFPKASIQYLSLPALGNISGSQVWVPPNQAEAEQALMVAAQLVEKFPTVLMCSERDHARCHRAAVAEVLAAKLGLRIEHLT